MLCGAGKGKVGQDAARRALIAGFGREVGGEADG